MKRTPAHRKDKIDTKVTKGRTKGTKNARARAVSGSLRVLCGAFVRFVSVFWTAVRFYVLPVPPSSIARKIAFITCFAAAGGFFDNERSGT